MSTPPDRSTAVLLDIDGTLIDSTYHHALAWQRAFARRGLILPFWRIHRAVGMGGDRLVGHVAGDEVEEEHGDPLREAWKEEYAELEAEVAPLPGAADLVRRLVGQGHRVALASSGDPDFARHAVERLGAGEEIAVLTTAEDAESSKPAPDLVRTTLDRLGEEAVVERAVLVGDTPYDVESAARAGLRCVALLSGGFSEAELRQAGAAVVVSSPGDLLDLDWDEVLDVPTTRDDPTAE